MTMALEYTLPAYLMAHAGLSALVGDKVYPDMEPQNVEQPYVCFEVISREKLYTHDGYTTTSIYSLQVSTYAASKDDAIEIAAQVFAAMDAWPTAAPDNVGFCVQEGEGGIWVEGIDLYCIDQDYAIFYNE